MRKTIFITGTSSGLGKLTALYFANQGWNVAATMRSPEKETELTKKENIRLFPLDVTNREQVKTAVAGAIAAFGRIDVVVNNAGMGTFGALELAKEDDIDWQLAVNVRGPINIIRAFLPQFRSHGGGKFINISSIIGLATGMPLQSLYVMSKFALEGLTEALYYELKAQNIDLHLVEQGGSEGNNFGDNITWSDGGDIRAYDELLVRVKNRIATAGPEYVGSAQEIVDVIYGLATGENQQFRNPVGNMSKMLLGLRGAVPIEEYLEKIAANFA